MERNYIHRPSVVRVIQFRLRLRSIVISTTRREIRIRVLGRGVCVRPFDERNEKAAPEEIVRRGARWIDKAERNEDILAIIIRTAARAASIEGKRSNEKRKT